MRIFINNSLFPTLILRVVVTFVTKDMCGRRNTQMKKMVGLSENAEKYRFTHRKINNLRSHIIIIVLFFYGKNKKKTTHTRNKYLKSCFYYYWKIEKYRMYYN